MWRICLLKKYAVMMGSIQTNHRSFETVFVEKYRKCSDFNIVSANIPCEKFAKPF